MGRQHQGMDRPGVRQVPEGNGEQGKTEETCDCLKFLSIYFYLFVGTAGVFCHQLALLGTDFRAVGCGGFVETLN